MKTRVNCIECPCCGDLVYSRAHHDCRWCSCEVVFIDGGFGYTRVGFKSEAVGDKIPKMVKKFIIGVSRKNLYDDWNNGTDKYGIIKGEKNDITKNKVSNRG